MFILLVAPQLNERSFPLLYSHISLSQIRRQNCPRRLEQNKEGQGNEGRRRRRNRRRRQGTRAAPGGRRRKSKAGAAGGDDDAGGEGGDGGGSRRKRSPLRPNSLVTRALRDLLADSAAGESLNNATDAWPLQTQKVSPLKVKDDTEHHSL
jgi:hypothetical protein